MSKEGTLVTIGILTAVSPFLGLPYSWLAWILPVLGILAVIVGYVIKKDKAELRSLYEIQSPQAS